MAPMAMPDQAMSAAPLAVRQRGWRMAWLLWVVVSVIGAVIAALIGWQIRTLVAGDFTYGATVVSAVIAAGSQWLILRRYRVDAYWWVPATIVADLVNVIVVEPSVLNRFIAAPDTTMSTATIVFGGALTLAAGGLVVGIAQAFVLRPVSGNVAWAWIPATIVGGGLAGALTTGLAGDLFAFPYPLALSAITGIGALLTAASQVPVFLRVLR